MAGTPSKKKKPDCESGSVGATVRQRPASTARIRRGRAVRPILLLRLVNSGAPNASRKSVDGSGTVDSWNARSEVRVNCQLGTAAFMNASLVKSGPPPSTDLAGGGRRRDRLHGRAGRGALADRGRIGGLGRRRRGLTVVGRMQSRLEHGSVQQRLFRKRLADH